MKVFSNTTGTMNFFGTYTVIGELYYILKKNIEDSRAGIFDTVLVI
jgi:hypothetical protein